MCSFISLLEITIVNITVQSDLVKSALVSSALVNANSLDVLKIIFMVDAEYHTCNLCPKYGSSAGNKRGATDGGRLYIKII